MGQREVLTVHAFSVLSCIPPMQILPHAQGIVQTTLSYLAGLTMSFGRTKCNGRLGLEDGADALLL